MANTFKALNVKKADKDNYVVVDVQFANNSKIYTYVRKFYNASGFSNNYYTILNGVSVEFVKNADGSFVLTDENKEYETEGKRIRTTTATLSGERVKGRKNKNRKEKSVVEEIKKKIKEEKIEISAAPEYAYNPDTVVYHKEFETIKTCIEADIPVYLVGPAGSGKNHTLEQIAKELGLEFYFTNSVQQEYKITGFIDAGGVYHETEFYKAFVNGGIFFLDEMDASIPEVLVLLNAAIANRYFEFPNGKVTAHENFRVVAAGNTVGSGADENYTGRMVLDQATLDRFTIITFDYDKEIELHLAKGNVELVDFIEALRNTAEVNAIRTTFSYRCITMVAKLEGKMELAKIIEIAVVKGLSKDVISILANNNSSDNKYAEALKKIAA